MWQIAVDGTRSLLQTIGLSHPTGLAIGADGALYISNFGDSGGGGQIVRVAIPEPGVVALLLVGLAGAAFGFTRRGASGPSGLLRSRTGAAAS